MKDIRIDTDGNPRCWNCGSKGFTEKRTLRSKAMVGVGAMLTKKKMKCQRCGEYNDTGNGKPYDGPQGRKYKKQYEKEQAAIADAAAPVPVPPAAPAADSGDVGAKLAQLAELHASGALSDEEFTAAKSQLLQ